MAFVEVLAFLVFCGLVQSTDAFCNVTCTTDFISVLNCSNFDSAKQTSCLVDVECSDHAEAVSGSCVTGPSQHWCVVQPDAFDEMVAFDTVCTLRANQRGTNRATVETYDSKNWTLYESIKPRPPFNLTLNQGIGAYNLTWDSAYTKDENVYIYSYLIHRVRLRAEGNPDEEPMYYSVRQSQTFLEIPHEELLCRRVYAVDVQSSTDPSFVVAEWSEWSHGIEWRCSESEGVVSWMHWFLPLVLFLTGLFVLLIYSLREDVLKTLAVCQHVPDPKLYFTPLYYTYGGDFKKWVGPILTFSDEDVLEKSAPLQVLSEKQGAALGQQGQQGQAAVLSDNRRPSNPADLRSASWLCFHGDRSHGTTCSSGHISIDTVTVSGQQGTMSDWFGEGVEDGYGSPLLARRDIADDPYNVDVDLQARDVERISLSSYSPSLQSDYGYPRMGLDMDTIDSGFLDSDCSSPVSTEFDDAEKPGSATPVGAGDSQSNYVKQTVAFTAANGDIGSVAQQSP